MAQSGTSPWKLRGGTPMCCRFLIPAFLGVALMVTGGSARAADPSSAADSLGVLTATATGLPGPVDPANFVTKIDNPWFPLTPSTTLTYEGTKDDKRAVRVSVVTSKTKVIEGVTCVVVEDKVSLGGSPAERSAGLLRSRSARQCLDLRRGLAGDRTRARDQERGLTSRRRRSIAQLLHGGRTDRRPCLRA